MTYSALEDTRYTDEDLRSDDELWEKCVAFARDYKGDWPPMIKARQAAFTIGLTVASARMVANVMRQDAMASYELPDRSRMRVAMSPQKLAEAETASLAIEEPKQVRNKRFYLPVTRWNMDFLMSIHPSAQVSHLLNHSNSSILYIRRDNLPWKKAFTLKMSTECGQRPAEKYARLFPTPEGRRICNSCLITRQARAEAL